MAYIKTEDDQAGIDKEVQRLKSLVKQYSTDIVNIETVQIPELQRKESTNQKFFYKQDSIIASYNEELKQILGGPTQISPVIEADLVNLTGGRLWPPNQLDLKRIPEFDGLGVSTFAASYEKIRLTSYSPYQYVLVNGLNTVTAISGLTASIITNSSTSILFNFDPTVITGKQFIVHAATAGQSFIGACSTAGDNSLVSQSTGPLVIGRVYTIVSYVTPDDFVPAGSADNNPGTVFTATSATATFSAGSVLSYTQSPTQWTVSFSFITPITANIPTGAAFNGTWLGFNNTERTAKISTSSFAGARQTVLNALINNLNVHITAQLVFQNAAKAAIISNSDAGLDPAALTDTSTAVTYYTNYLLTLDISDSGFLSLNNTNTARAAKIDVRKNAIAPILLALYEKRYFWAVQRSGSGGSLLQILRTSMALDSAKTDLADAERKLYRMGEHGINVI